MENKVCRRRRSTGVTMLAVMMAAVTILLPIGLFAFEVARIQMAQKQLRSATDAAALAAASYLSNVTGNDAQNLAKAKSLALELFKENIVMSDFLSESTLSATAATDNPDTQKATLDITVDTSNGRVRATSSYGLSPAFATFLGLKTETVRSKSLAGYHGLEGDIAIVVDISDSMTVTSDAWIVKKTYDAGSGKTTYTKVKNTAVHPALGRFGALNSIPNPNTVNWDLDPLMSKFKDRDLETKMAALTEAKRGSLESTSMFQTSHADKGPLGGFITPAAGYQTAYQKLALTKVLPLHEAKDALTTFVSQLPDNGDAHLALVTFGGKTSGTEDAKDTYSTFVNHKYPHVKLNKDDAKKQLTIDSIGPSLTFNGTDTKGGMAAARLMLNDPALHRPEVEKTIILLTDGMPTTGSPQEQAKLAKKDGIRLFAIGFFKTANAKQNGPPVLKNMVANCGNGSKMYYAPDLPTLQDVLAQISHGTLALLNEE